MRRQRVRAGDHQRRAAGLQPRRRPLSPVTDLNTFYGYLVPETGAFTGTNHLDIAVSQTSSPLGGWNIYRLPVQDDGTQGTPSHTDCPCIGDYPHLGADKYGFYVTTNEYPFSDDPGVFGNNFNGAQLYAFSKAALAVGAATVNVVQFENLVLGDGTPGFTVWPAQVPDNRYATRDNGTEYLLSSWSTRLSRLSS